MVEARLDASSDAYVDEASPSTNFGGGADLYVTSQGGVAGDGDRRLLATFDLDQLDDRLEAIVEAVLELAPRQVTDGRTLEARELDAAFTEDGVTWDTQPTAGEVLDTHADTADTPHAFTVTAALAAGDAVLHLRVQDESEGSSLSPEQEYPSREASQQGPVLVVDQRLAEAADLSSDVTVSKDKFSDLTSWVTPRFSPTRYAGVHTLDWRDENRDAYPIADLAWDTPRDQVWSTVPASGAVVHRHDPDGTHDAQFSLVDAEGNPVSDDVRGVAAADGNVYVAVADADDTVHECTVDDPNNELISQTAFTAHNNQPDYLAYDGDDIWIYDFFSGEIEERNPNNWALGTSAAIDPETLGLAAPLGENELWTLKGQGGLGPWRRRDHDDPTQILDTYAYTGSDGDPRGMALTGNSESGSLLAQADGNDAMHRFVPSEIESALEIGSLIREADLDAQVQPGSVPAHADLASTVKVGTEADLSATATPRVDRTADIDAAVQPASLTSHADFTSVVAPGTDPIEPDRARVIGRVAPRIPIDPDTMHDVSGEVGSPIVVDPDGDADDLRRVVQLLGSEASVPQQHTRTQARLREGDAILYAQSGDDFAPGTVLAYGGHRWTVLGSLGFERVGDADLFEQVGLRRLATVHRARVEGTVERSDTANLYSQLEVNVP